MTWTHKLKYLWNELNWQAYYLTHKRKVDADHDAMMEAEMDDEQLANAEWEQAQAWDDEQMNKEWSEIVKHDMNGGA